MHSVYTHSGTDYRNTGQETDARTAAAVIFAARTDVPLRGKRLPGHVPVPGEPHAPMGHTDRRKAIDRKINRNPIMFGIRLTDEQVEQIRDGQPVYIEGMRYENRIFDGYLVMDDKLTRGLAYTDKDPNEWVKYGKYTMRRMDRDLIERGYTVRALVQWWRSYGHSTCGKRSRKIPDIRRAGETRENPGKICGRTGRRNGTPVIKRSRGRGL